MQEPCSTCEKDPMKRMRRRVVYGVKRQALLLPASFMGSTVGLRAHTWGLGLRVHTWGLCLTV